MAENDRLLVTITKVWPNFKAATLASGKVVFVRESSMRGGPHAVKKQK